jgi:hypothetical protein
VDKREQQCWRRSKATRIEKGTNNTSNVVWRGMNNNAKKEQKRAL